jgi:hypothetical protein
MASASIKVAAGRIRMALNRTKQIAGDLACQSIRSEPNEMLVDRLVYEAAIYLGIVGQVREANRLLAHFWLLGRPMDRRLERLEVPLMMLWHASGEFPQSTPFLLLSADAIELRHRRDSSGNFWTPSFLEREPTDESQRRFRRFVDAMISIAPTMGELPSKEIEIEAISDFEAFYQPGNRGYETLLALTNLAELCAKNGRMDQAEHYVRLWHEAFVVNYENFDFGSLAACRHVAPLLVQGLLAQVSEVDAPSGAEMVDHLIAAIADRTNLGPASIYQADSWPNLLTRLSHLALAAAQIEFPDLVHETGWLGRDGATDEELAEVESKLKIALPDEYKGFLRTSNGFHATSSTGVFLVEAAKVTMLNTEYPDLVDIWQENADVGEGLARSVLIGDNAGEQQLLLFPKSESNWECWFFASWVPGEERYPSFRSFIEREILRLEMLN